MIKSCMGTRRNSARHVKLRIDVGGINCPYCTRLPPRELKVLTRRAIRNLDKQELRNFLSKEY